jgi:hypothetical protein
MAPHRDQSGHLIFPDHPEFRPNLTPREIFEMGAFGGTYWRPILSKIAGNRELKDRHKHQRIRALFAGIPADKLTRPFPEYDTGVNKYGVKCGSSLEYWEDHGWIKEPDYYGWMEWYCHFYAGRRIADDRRQIDRWLALAGPRGRFFVRKNKSPVVRQTLLHWAIDI